MVTVPGAVTEFHRRLFHPLRSRYSVKTPVSGRFERSVQ